MARINWEDFKAKTESQSSGANSSRVSYFTLKNDQDESVVRFMHDSPEDFDLLVVHKAQDEQGKWKSVNCLRQPSDPIEMCPICAEGGKPDYKIFVHLLEYVRQEDGTIKPVAKVWERPSAFAKKLANLIKEYGPLSECLFKIKRNGAKGSLKTDYDTMYLSDKVYPSHIYVKDTTLFENYQALGHAVLDKSYEELVGSASAMQEKPVEEPTYVASAPTMPVPTYNTPPTYNAPPTMPAMSADRPARTYTEPQQTSTVAPAQPGEGRPRRYY